MKSKLYFIIGSHNNIQGIKSYFKILKNILPRYQICIRKKIKLNSINILVENFSSSDVKQIIQLKTKNKIKIILLITEFYNKKLNTFNCFDIERRNIRKLNILFIYILKIIYKIKLFFYWILSYFFPTLKQFIKNNYLASIRRTKEDMIKKQISFNQMFEKIHRYNYFKKRYLNFSKLIKYSDLIMVSHPKIYQTYKKKYNNIFYTFPKIKAFKSNKNFKISQTFKFSGQLNIYRKFFFKKFKYSIKNYTKFSSLNLFFKKINKVHGSKFIDIKKKYKYKFSFHPRREFLWRYSSPIRYIDAVVSGEVPVVFDKFNDFVSKNLTIYININSKESINKLLNKFYKNHIKFINNGIKKYNNIVVENNNKLEIEISKLFRD